MVVKTLVVVGVGVGAGCRWCSSDMVSKSVYMHVLGVRSVVDALRLSSLQRWWAGGRYSEGRNAAENDEDAHHGFPLTIDAASGLVASHGLQCRSEKRFGEGQQWHITHFE